MFTASCLKETSNLNPSNENPIWKFTRRWHVFKLCPKKKNTWRHLTQNLALTIHLPDHLVKAHIGDLLLTSYTDGFWLIQVIMFQQCVWLVGKRESLYIRLQFKIRFVKPGYRFMKPSYYMIMWTMNSYLILTTKSISHNAALYQKQMYSTLNLKTLLFRAQFPSYNNNALSSEGILVRHCC